MAKSFNDLPAPVQGVILAAIAVVLAIGFFFYGIPGVVNSVWSLSAKRTSLEAQVNRLHAENLKNQAVERERTELLNRIAQLATQLDTLRSIVPDEQAQDAFVKSVYDTAAGSTIFLRSFVAQPLVTRELFVEMPFTVRIDGTYYALLSFFDRLARQQRIVNVAISSLSMGPPSAGGQGTFKLAPGETVGANCVITTYFNRPQPPPAPAPAKPR
jgi:Tfp pilus assembly protein PilO